MAPLPSSSSTFTDDSTVLAHDDAEKAVIANVHPGHSPRSGVEDKEPVAKSASTGSPSGSNASSATDALAGGNVFANTMHSCDLGSGSSMQHVEPAPHATEPRSRDALASCGFELRIVSLTSGTSGATDQGFLDELGHDVRPREEAHRRRARGERHPAAQLRDAPHHVESAHCESPVAPA